MSILDKFTVVDLLKTRSASIANVTGNYLKFNNQTTGELGYAPYVQILLNPKDKQFAIRACKEDDPHAVEFSKPKGKQKTPIKYNTAAVVNAIRKMGNWNTEDNWNIPGVYFAEANAIVYDVKAATKPVPNGGGWNLKKQREMEENELESVEE